MVPHLHHTPCLPMLCCSVLMVLLGVCVVSPVSATPPRELTQTQTLELAVENHRTLRAARVSIRRAVRQVEGSETFSPWVLTADASYTHDDQPIRDAFTEGVQIRDTFNWSLGLFKAWAFGLDTSLNFTNATTRNEVPVAFPSPTGDIVRDRRVVGPVHIAILTLSFTYHILAGGDPVANQLLNAQNRAQQSLAEVDLERQASEVTLQVLQVYWDLWLAEATLEVRRNTLSSVDRQRQVTRELVAGGIVAQIELNVIEEQRLRAEEAILVAEANIDQRAIALERLLAEESRGLNPSIRTDAVLSIPAAPSDSLEALVERAHNNSYAVQQLREQRKTQGLEVTRTEAALDPTLDVNLTFRQQGLDDTVSFRDGYVLESYRQVGLLEAGAVTAGVNFAIPLDNDVAESEADAAKIEVSRIDAQLSAVRGQVTEQIRATLRSINVLRRRITLLERSAKLAERNLESGQERFKAGLIATLDVQQLQDQVEESQLAVLTAQVDLIKQTYNLDHLTGDLLARFNIVVE